MNVSRTQDARQAYREMGATLTLVIPKGTTAASNAALAQALAGEGVPLPAVATTAAIPPATLTRAVAAATKLAMSTGEKVAIAGGVLVVLAGGAYLLFFRKGKRHNPRRRRRSNPRRRRR